MRRSKFLVPLMNNNILLSGEEAVATQQIQPTIPLDLPCDEISVQNETFNWDKVLPKSNTPVQKNQPSLEILDTNELTSKQHTTQLATIEPDRTTESVKSTPKSNNNDQTTLASKSDEEIINMIENAQLQPYK